ncbi:TPA: hypothetical protein VEO38_002295 [Providencia alcalifaciens]|nr:hypothetical protein [Providencia alcalifaciens]
MSIKLTTQTQRVTFNEVPSILNNKNQSKGISLDSVKSVENKPNVPLKSALKPSNAQENVSKVTKKTIHIKDTKALNNQAAIIISKIQHSLNAILYSTNNYQPKSLITEMKSDLQQLRHIAKSYNDKLESSSYKHHQSKLDAATQVNTDINTIQSTIDFADVVRQENNTNLEKKAKAQEELASKIQKTKVSQTPRTQSVNTKFMNDFQLKQQRVKDYAEYGHK